MSEEGNEGGEEGGRSFSQEDVNRINAKANRTIEDLKSKIAALPTSDAIDELQAKLDAVTQEHELAGKSEVERLKHEQARQLEKMSNRIGSMEGELKERDAAVTSAQETLKNERMARAFGASLQKANVFPAGAGDALAVLMSQIADAEVADNGSVTASYGQELIDEGPDAIAMKFIEDRPYFASAKAAGGSGTPRPNGKPSGANVIADMTTDELFEEAGEDPSKIR